MAYHFYILDLDSNLKTVHVKLYCSIVVSISKFSQDILTALRSQAQLHIREALSYPMRARRSHNALTYACRDYRSS